MRNTSPKGAMGLMQLMPATARELCVKNPYDPTENIMGGTRYFKGLLDRYRGDTALALAAYNWGMGNMEKNPEKMPRETTDYISRIARYYREIKA
jgi:soluble lytic murein transglycosylase-like protein